MIDGGRSYDFGMFNIKLGLKVPSFTILDFVRCLFSKCCALALSLCVNMVAEGFSALLICSSGQVSNRIFYFIVLKVLTGFYFCITYIKAS